MFHHEQTAVQALLPSRYSSNLPDATLFSTRPAKNLRLGACLLSLSCKQDPPVGSMCVIVHEGPTSLLPELSIVSQLVQAVQHPVQSVSYSGNIPPVILPREGRPHIT